MIRKCILHKAFSLLLLLIFISPTAHGNTSVDEELQGLIKQHNLTGNPLTSNTIIQKVESDQVQLGMLLFFSKTLSGSYDVACASCHHPVLGGGDSLSLGVGVGAKKTDLLGTGRRHGEKSINYNGVSNIPRNSPTIFNVAAWKKTLFHDGRVENLENIDQHYNGYSNSIKTPDSLFGKKNDPLSGKNIVAAQARFPIVSNDEMLGFEYAGTSDQDIRIELANRLKKNKNWIALFQKAFNDRKQTVELITEQNIAYLLGEYERSQILINTPWKWYIEGDIKAISNTAKKGALLFFKSPRNNGAGCVACHSGDLFSDESPHNLAMPQIGGGKGDGVDGLSDFGYFRETLNPNHKYSFRTPTLLNVEVTGPWSHSGSYNSLRAVVNHHINPKRSILNYDGEVLRQKGIENLDGMHINTFPALIKLENEQLEGFSKLQKFTLTNEEISQLISFLKALTDPCVKDRECLSKWIPDQRSDPDGNQLNAIGQDGGFL